MKKLLIIFCFAALSATSIQAQKFGYVDSKYILEQMPEYKAAQTEIDAQSQKWQKVLEEKYQEIEKMYEEYRAEEILLPEDLRKQRQEDIFAKEREAKEYKKLKFGYDGELYKMQDDRINPIQEQVYMAIEALAKEKKLDFILDKTSSSGILYANPLYDRTEDVIKKLGITK